MSEALPQGWAAGELGDFLAKSEYGISHALKNSGELAVLRMNNIAQGEAELSDVKFTDFHVPESLLLKDGDVLFNRTNSLEHVGRTGIWRGQISPATFASYLVRLVPLRDRLRPEILNRMLNEPAIQKDMRRWATPGVHQVNINPTNLRRLPVAFPCDLIEQDRIGEMLDTLDVAIREAEAVVAKLRQ